MATGRDEVLAVVGTEDRKWEPGNTGSDPSLEPGIHYHDFGCLLQCCSRSARLTWRIVRTEIDHMVDSTSMEHTPAVA